ncbi:MULTISPECIES: hypothetical protein [unclassified Mameliella]|uniref:hypothetical protein n=1 Tax=Mameliella sp. LZ-28 TaxID=2484146 RepID=UPI00143F7968|nr:hypothetical protein [Mameliella sp. LZ-28]MCR9276232.1 hypothetical protein [Paracoccaceae bacterium]
MTRFFTIIEDAFVLIRTGGVYQQSQLYARGNKLFAKKGAGFIRLGIGGETSAPNTRWTEIEQGDLAVIEDRNGHPPILTHYEEPKIAAE